MQQASAGTLEIVGLAPGRYEVEQRDPKSGTASRTSTIDVVHGAVEMEATEGQASGTVTVTVEGESGAKLPGQMQVLLRGSSPGDAQGRALDAKAYATFAGLRPEEYHVVVYGDNRMWQVVRLEESGKREPKNSLRITPGETVEVKVVIAGTASAVEGMAVRNGRPTAGAMIVLVPVDAMEEPEMFRRDQSDLDGTFLLPDVPAGRYIVVAIEDGWKLEWGKADVLARYLAKGAAVEIPASERRSVHLPDPIVVQQR